MSKYQQIKQHLPQLYQPEVQDTNLLNLLLKELGGNMDEIGRLLTNIMQAHWYRTADKASFDDHFIRARRQAGLAPLDSQHQPDQQAIAAHPYLLDLVRLGALLSIPPWREPSGLRESVEAYRQRLLRIINIYRNGLGTLEAMRQMVTAELPEDSERLLPAQQRSFSMEENSPCIGALTSIQSIGLPVETIGPLMRWQLSNSDQAAVAPIIYIQGIEATQDHAATALPVVERFNLSGTVDPEDSLVGLGIAYNDTIESGITLRLTPAYSAFIAGPTGIEQAAATTSQVSLGHWQETSGQPAGRVVASVQTADKIMWFALDNAGNQQLWRFDGSAWLEVLTAETLAPIHCLYQRQQYLLIGSDAGLDAMPLFLDVAADPDAYSLHSITAFSTNPVYCIKASKQNPMSVYVGSANGLDLLDIDNSISQTLLTATSIRAIIESDLVLYFGGDIGVMQYRFSNQQLYYLSAEFESELQPDWLEFEAGILPDTETFGLPAVLSLMLGDDNSLWIGTVAGLARYRARKEAELVYRNLMEAFADLVDGAVTKIRKDEYGFVWFATNRGLLRFDGRDIARLDKANGQWTQLGQADQRYPADLLGAGPVAKELPLRGLWRYHKILAQWQIFDDIASAWTGFTAASLLEQDSILEFVFIDSVKAELGTLTANEFSPISGVPAEKLLMRCKPDHTRIVNGGLAAIPRMPQGDSNWRYLSLEPTDLVEPAELPWWSIEGRLVPPPEYRVPFPGRFGDTDQLPVQSGAQLAYQLGEMIYAYDPAAKIKFQWATINHCVCWSGFRPGVLTML